MVGTEFKEPKFQYGSFDGVTLASLIDRQQMVNDYVRTPGMDISFYLMEKEKLIQECLKDLDKDSTMQLIAAGLGDPVFCQRAHEQRLRLMLENPNGKLERFKDWCNIFDTAQSIIATTKQPPPTLPATVNAITTKEGCYTCGKTGHRSYECPTKRVLSCTICKMKGHEAKGCRNIYCQDCKAFHLKDCHFIECKRCHEKHHKSQRCKRKAEEELPRPTRPKPAGEIVTCAEFTAPSRF
eukprot:TRINITY_DN346_c0_g1_i5.p1 TRINITY_DN346_c0_g1~~TRINITY_DN346_c0_g1_i5.p1  ORF type:complete len:239 (-),score=0.15 TRINITY_DN346_c0_g1_i5:433-1149(-)